MDARIRYLSLSTLIDSAGATLFVSALALSVFNVESSAVKASSIYIVQFLPAIFLLPLAVNLCDRYAVRAGLISVEIVSALMTLLAGLCVQADLLMLLYLLLIGRGFIDLTTKTFRSIGVKIYSDPASLSQANNLVMGGGFIGQALGAFGGFFLISHISLFYIAVINASTYLLSALCCLKLTVLNVRAETRSFRFLSGFAGFTEIRQNKDLMVYFMYFSLVVIVFQSYNQIARTWIPLAWLDLGLGEGIIGEIIGCFGIIAGLLVVNLFFSRPKQPKGVAFIAILITCLCVSSPFVTVNPAVSLTLYFIYMVLFEIGLMVSMNGLLTVCPQHRVASVMGLFYGVSFGGLTLSGLSMALVVDRYKLPIVSLVIAIVALIVLFGILSFSCSFNTKNEPPDSEFEHN